MAMTAGDGLPAVPLPGRIPESRPPTALSAAERARRKQAGPRTRLTRKLIEQVTTTIRSGTPAPAAWSYAGVNRSTVQMWMRTANQAEGKRWNDRTQLDRLCLELQESVRQAEGQAAVLLHGAMAQAAGLTRERPKIRTIRQRIVGDDTTVDEQGRVSGGRVTEVIVEEREVAPDWRAAAHIGRYRFPETMSPEPAPDEDTTAAPTVDSRTLYERLLRATQAPDPRVTEAIETTAIVTRDENVTRDEAEDDDG